MLVVGTAVAATVVGEVDVSATPGSQAEVSIAVDPRDARTLLAASNSGIGVGVLAYSSTDGGAAWSTSRPSDALPGPLRGAGDPVTAIDGDGTQLLAQLTVERGGTGSEPGLALESRAAADAPWTATLVPVAGEKDKPALAVDATPGSSYAHRVYLAWADGEGRIALVHSDDRGATWGAPLRLASASTFTALAVAPDGTLYAAWWNRALGRVVVARSRDGGDSLDRGFSYALSGRPPRGWLAPAQPSRGVTPVPGVGVGRDGRVYLTWSDRRKPSVDVLVAVLTPDLRPLRAPRLVAPNPKRRADRVLPALAVDAHTQDVWICFYASDGARRRSVRFTCSVSRDDGATWRATPVASRRSSPAPGAPFNFGDYEGVAARGGVAHPVWSDARERGRGGDTEIFTAAVRP